MIDLQKVNATKEKILSTIQASGPSFPTRISRETSISPLFVGALLSEMVSEKKLVMSKMKVGSSPLYFMPGQEASLESFLQYLNGKEREAVEKLKDKQILDDSSEEPATRVALRKLRDFAMPFTYVIEGEEKLFWRYFTLPEENALIKLNEKFKVFAPIKYPEKSIKEEVTEKIENKIIEKEKEVDETRAQPKKTRVKPEKKPSAFAVSVKDYLLGKNIEILHEHSAKAKEYQAKVRVDTLFGKQDFLLIAKDKKKITEDDLAIALHKAQVEKMPSLIMARGDLDKDAKLYLENWKNLLKFEKLKI